MSMISMKMRMGVETTIYRKTLQAQYISSNTPEVLNLMSTDTNSIVNSCISFHSLWSIPFRVNIYFVFHYEIHWFFNFLYFFLR